MSPLIKKVGSEVVFTANAFTKAVNCFECLMAVDCTLPSFCGHKIEGGSRIKNVIMWDDVGFWMGPWIPRPSKFSEFWVGVSESLN